MKPKSPIRVVINAFLPASAADFFSNQNPINRYEVNPTSSQKMKIMKKLLASTSPSMEKQNNER